MSKVLQATLHLQQGKDTVKKVGETKVQGVVRSESLWCPGADPKVARRFFSTARRHPWICSKSPLSLCHRPERHFSYQAYGPGNPQACMQTDIFC